MSTFKRTILGLGLVLVAAPTGVAFAFVSPSVTTNAATSVMSSDATLNGTNGSSAAIGHSFWVSLSPFVTGSPTVPSGVYSTQDLGALPANTPFSALLSSVTTSGYPSNMPSITSNTPYYFAAWSNIGGTWYPGTVLNFTTASVCNGGTFDGFTLGTVNAQGGWSATGPYDQEIVPNTYGFPTFGCKTLRLSDALTSGSFGDWIFTSSQANEAGETSSIGSGFSGGTRQNHFEAQFDFASTQSVQQPGMHVSISPDRGDGARMSYVRLEDQADGVHAFFDDYAGGDFNETEIAGGAAGIPALSRTAPHTVKFVMDFVNGPSNDVVKVYIDSSLAITGTSWEDYFRDNQPDIAPPTVDSLIIQSRTGGGPLTNPADAGKGFLFDNFSASTATLPGTLEITKYVCPIGTSVLRSANGVGMTVPNGCVPQAGKTFGYVHGSQEDANAPYPELGASFTSAGATDVDGKISLGLPADGRYLVAETDDGISQLPSSEVLGLYCIGDGDTSDSNDNQELTFVPANGIVKCVAYDQVPTATLTLEKVVNETHGGTAVATDWILGAEGVSPMTTTVSGVTGDSAITAKVIPAGTYALSETGGPSGYDASAWECTAGSLDGNALTLAKGDSATCTITNSDKPAKIKIKKTVLSPDGSWVHDHHAFEVSIDAGSSYKWFRQGHPAYFSVNAGSYTASEKPDADYETVGITNDGATTVGVGDHVTLTVTNKQKVGTLHVVKHVLNHNGLGHSIASDFSFSVNGGPSIPFGIFGGDTSIGNADASVNPGWFHVHEVAPDGYASSLSGDCHGWMASNEHDKTCTITNDIIPPGQAAITVIKDVINDNGGTAESGDFPLQITDTSAGGGDPIGPILFSVIPPSPTPVTSGQATFVDATAGDTYAVGEGEGGPSGYVQTNISCTDNGGTISGPSFVALPNHSYICTITNDDIAPRLTLVKEVDNSYGEITVGSATADEWTVSASSTEDEDVGVSGAGTVTTGGTFQTGSYDLSESGGPEGYTPSEAWSCVVNGNEPQSMNTIELGLGDVATCTMVNTAQPVELTLVKRTDDSSGDGTFHFRVTGTDESMEFSTNVTVETTEGMGSETISIPAGAFDINEVDLPEGWRFAGVSCSYDEESFGESIPSGGEHIVVNNGDHVTCTFHDTRKAVLSIKKVVINNNAGTATASNFSFQTFDGESTSSPIAFESDGQNDIVVNPGTYTVTEVAADGYTSSSEGCSSITLAAGGTATCTITNDDAAPVVTPQVPQGSGGGGGPPSGSFGVVNSQPSLGRVLGAASSTVPTLGVDSTTPLSCSALLTTYMRMGKKNDPTQVMRLQQFLKDHGYNVSVTGYFGPITRAAVMKFQQDHANDILAPWGIKDPTGYVYKTTLFEINKVACPTLNAEAPQI